MTDATDQRPWLRESSEPLAVRYDVALLDLDGTVYTGDEAIPGAATAVAAARELGVRVGYVTNNASRSPDVVAEHLVRLGLAATRDVVLTSAQAAAALLADQLPAGSPVLVVGGAGLVAAVREHGLRPVDRADENPVAVIQGWAPELGWSLLAEGAYALARGLPWIATNTDRTLPTARGIAPGNGSFVALLTGVVGRSPDAVAGKPYAALLSQAARRFGAQRPLVVGDRLDTDIEGGWASGLPSLLVLTGVTGVEGLLLASPRQRPTYLAADLTGLLTAHPQAEPSADGGWGCGGWSAEVSSDGQLRVQARSTAGPVYPFDALRAACAAAWSAADHGLAVSWAPELPSALAVG